VIDLVIVAGPDFHLMARNVLHQYQFVGNGGYVQFPEREADRLLEGNDAVLEMWFTEVATQIGIVHRHDGVGNARKVVDGPLQLDCRFELGHFLLQFPGMVDQHDAVTRGVVSLFQVMQSDVFVENDFQVDHI